MLEQVVSGRQRATEQAWLIFLLSWLTDNPTTLHSPPRKPTSFIKWILKPLPLELVVVSDNQNLAILLPTLTTCSKYRTLTHSTLSKRNSRGQHAKVMLHAYVVVYSLFDVAPTVFEGIVVSGPCFVMFILKLKIQRNEWLFVDTCPQAANQCTQNKAQWMAACGHVSASSQSMHIFWVWDCTQVI